MKGGHDREAGPSFKAGFFLQTDHRIDDSCSGLAHETHETHENPTDAQ
ncbi:MAG: hypothetical protein ABI273_16865 [Lacunisphaera sp.]